ncbi:MAG: YfiR family protein [Candidatus Competibacteraceae bacterium]|nr:MAG: YfiR family protein [Candidatus Competibacteraceae bacterium]
MADQDRRLVFSWRYWLVVLATVLLAGALLGSATWASRFDEYAVKAAYLYNFAKFVEWPPEVFSATDSPLVICIAGDNPFGTALEALRDKVVEGRPVEVRHIPTATGLDRCNVVFIGRAEQRRLKTVLAELARLPILTVSDIGGFAQAGGMIGLFETEQRIRFNINIMAARQANLKLSSQLLKLATIVN